MSEISTSAENKDLTPPSGKITDPAKEAIQQAQAEIMKAMAASKASIEAAVRQYATVAESDGMQDSIQSAVEQAMEAQQSAIQIAQDQALMAITAAVARYPPAEADPGAANSVTV